MIGFILSFQMLAGSAINVGIRLITLIVTNHHIRAAGKAALRGARSELIAHVKRLVAGIS